MRTTALAYMTIALFASAALGQPPAAGQDLDRVFRLTHSETAQDLQEIAVLIRTLSDIRQVSTDTAQRAFALRGTAAQVALAEWLFNELSQPANSGTHEYRTPGSAEDVVRVFYLSNAGTVQAVQEVAVVVRTIGDIRRLFTYNAPRVLVMRGTDEQMRLADWLIRELDQPANRQDSALHEYRLPGGGDNVVRVFYLPRAGTPQRLNEIAVQIRTTAEIRRVFIYTAPGAIALRGTAGQIAVADRLMESYR